MRRTHAVAVAVLLAVSVVAPYAALPVAAAPPGMTTVPADNVEVTSQTVSPGNPPTSALPAQAQGQRGPPPQALEHIPSHALERIQASQGAASLAVDVATTPSGSMALVLTDDDVHEGREIAVPTSMFDGEVPDTAYGVHESGEEWTADVTVDGDYAVFSVPHFTTNTVTFSGEVSLSATPATDGTTLSYDLNDLDSASDPAVNVTGVTNTDRDTKSVNGLSDGQSVSIDVAGTKEATNVTATFTGTEISTTDSYTDSSLSDGESTTFTVGGNQEPTSASVTFTGKTGTAETAVEDDQGDGTLDSTEITLGDNANNYRYDLSAQFTARKSGPLTSLKIPVDYAGGSDYGTEVSVYISESGADGTWREGTKIATWDPSWTTGYQTITTSSYNISAGTTYEVEFVTESTDNDGNGDFLQLQFDSSPTSTKSVTAENEASGTQNTKWLGLNYSVEATTKDPSVDVTGDGSADASYTGTLSEGETVTKSLPELSQGSETLAVSVSQAPVGVTVDWTENTITEDPSISLNGSTGTYTGTLASGETATVSLSTAPVGPQSADISLVAGEVDVAVDYTERTGTSNVAVGLNGTSTTVHSGTLSDGSSASATLSKSDLKTGTNNVTISLGDGSLSADAPTMQANVTYSHDASSDVSADYTGTKWSEEYNVSKTYADANDNAELTIPFADTVVAMRDVELRKNGGSWSSLSTSDYSVSGSTVTVDLGSVSSGDTVTVRANGSRVNPSNMQIEVVEATSPGSRLDSKIKVTSVSSGTHAIYTGGYSDKLHYTYNESYDAGTYHRFDSSGNAKLVFPNAGSGSTVRVRTVPVEVNPSTGDVDVTVQDGSVTEPRFKVEPGAQPDDDVAYRFTNTESGSTYALVSVSDSIVRDSAEAQSPVTLMDDDSEEVLEIQKDTTEVSVSEAADTGRVVLGPVSAEQDSPLLWAGFVLAALVGLFVISRLLGVQSAQEGVVSFTTTLAGPFVGAGKGVVSLVAPAAKTGTSAVSKRLFGTRLGLLTLGSVAAIALLRFNVLGLPEESRLVGGVAVIIIGAFVLLRRTGYFSWPVFGIVAGLVGLFGAETISPGSVIPQLAEGLGQVVPILALGGGYLVYRWIQARQQPNEVNRIVVGGDSDD